jgi:uncharacterized protein with HEPN domain
MRDTIERLRDIQEAITQIMKYTNQGREGFDQNELIQGWVILRLVIIGEAVRTIPQDYKNNHPEVPWEQINRMRNILVHIYFGINLDRVWSVVEDDLPILKISIDAILNTEETTQ